MAVKLANYSKTTSVCKLLVDGAVSVTQTAFTRCTATLRRHIKNENELSSWAGDAASQFLEKIQRRLLPADPRTRHHHSFKFKHILSHTAQYKHSFFVRTVPEWNSLPEACVNADTVTAFQTQLHHTPWAVCTPPIVVIRESGLTITELELELDSATALRVSTAINIITYTVWRKTEEVAAQTEFDEDWVVCGLWYTRCDRA